MLYGFGISTEVLLQAEECEFGAGFLNSQEVVPDGRRALSILWQECDLVESKRETIFLSCRLVWIAPHQSTPVCHSPTLLYISMELFTRFTGRAEPSP